MNRRSRVVGMAVLILWCLSLHTDILRSGQQKELPKPQPEEIQKMQEAIPNKPMVKPDKPRKLLVFDLCGPKGFRHGCIPYWDKALEIMGEKTGAFSVVISNDMDVFKPENLKQFDAVCFNSTTRLPFNPEKTAELCKSLMDFVKGGKGIVGIHAATDNFYEWPQAQEMMGGKFTGHPWGAGGTWAIKIDEPNHPLTAAFKGKGFKIKDEIYRTEPPLYSRDKCLVLMSLDTSDEATRNVKGFKPTDEDTGISWIKTWANGRVFYCSLGHNNEVTWNPPVLQHVLDGVQFALGDYKVDTKPKPGRAYSAEAAAKAGSPGSDPSPPSAAVSSGKGSEMADLQELLEKVKTYDWGQSRLALTEVSDIIKAAYGSPAKLSEIEKSLIGILQSDATYAGKQYVCRQLCIIGTEQSVPALAKMLTNDEYADMARYALERIPAEAVDEALRDALTKTSGKTKVGIINSLGERKDSKSATALSKLIYDSDNMIADAAASALGKICGSEATEALANAKDKISGKLQMVVLDAYLKCADQLAAQGKKRQALDIYQQLSKEDLPGSIRAAAALGKLNLIKKSK